MQNVPFTFPLPCDVPCSATAGSERVFFQAGTLKRLSDLEEKNDQLTSENRRLTKELRETRAAYRRVREDFRRAEEDIRDMTERPNDSHSEMELIGRQLDNIRVVEAEAVEATDIDVESFERREEIRILRKK